MARIKSIWDGWKHQTFGRLTGTGRHSELQHCAIGWLDHKATAKKIGKLELEGRLQAIAGYLRTTYEDRWNRMVKRQSETWPTIVTNVIVWANDVLRLTPRQFRAIDRKLQLEAALKAAEQQLST